MNSPKHTYGFQLAVSSLYMTQNGPDDFGGSELNVMRDVCVKRKLHTLQANKFRYLSHLDDITLHGDAFDVLAAA